MLLFRIYRNCLLYCRVNDSKMFVNTKSIAYYDELTITLRTFTVHNIFLMLLIYWQFALARILIYNFLILYHFALLFLLCASWVVCCFNDHSLVISIIKFSISHFSNKLIESIAYALVLITLLFYYQIIAIC